MASKTGSVNRNNLLGAGTVLSVETLDRTWSQFTFGIHFRGGDSTNEITTGVKVALIAGDDFTPDLATISPIWIEWVDGTITRTIKENYYSYGVLIASRDNVDRGYGNYHIQDSDPQDAGRPGPRYAIQLAGTEYRVHVNPRAGFAERAFVILSAPPTGFPFPLRLFAYNPNAYVAVRNIIAGSGTRPTTIYSKSNQIADFGSETINGATNASPIVISTVNPHGWLTGGYVVISGVGGNTAANGTWAITVSDSTHFSLVGSTGNGAYTSGGIAEFKVNRVFARIYQKGRWLGIDGFPVDIDTGVVL